MAYIAKSEVLFGNGEFSVREDNLQKLLKNLDEFEKSSGWLWSLCDCLGIREDGSLTKRFDEIQRSSNSKLETLKARMIEVMAAVDKSKIYRLHARRGETKALNEAQVAMKAKLIEAGIEEKAAEKMARVA